MNGAWCMVHGAWCMVRGAWCMEVHDEWCVVHGGAWLVVVDAEKNISKAESTRRSERKI